MCWSTSRPREAKFTPDGKELWVSSEVGGTISVIDPKTWKVTKKITFEVPGVRPEQLQPVGMDFTKDGKLVFVALGPANRVAVIDTATKEVQELHPGRPASLARRDRAPTARNIMSPTASPTI